MDISIEGSTCYHRLLTKIQRLVPVEQTTADIAGTRYPWLKVIDPDQLLENALSRTDRTSDELDPFWAATWRAAIGLDHFLRRSDIRGVRILELGCGSGRAGIAAALQGAEVTMTDAASEGLLVARFNAWPVRVSCKVRRLHWRDEILDAPKFPIIIGSDIVYDQSLWPILEPCIRRHLAPGGVVYLTEPQRHTGDRFCTWIQEAGWQMSFELLDLQDSQREIRVFTLRPSLSNEPLQK